MSDPRSTPDPDQVTGSDPAQVVVPVADILRTPDGPRDRQALFGEGVTVLGQRGGHSYVQAGKDGYVGFVDRQALGKSDIATHKVRVLATHCYTDATMKSQDLMTLSHGSLIRATGQRDGFIETTRGFVPAQHVTSAEQTDKDPVDVARIYLGTPYLWGGNSRLGLDCSGLVQAALTACGVSCPGDSDQQQATLGTRQAPGTAPQRGDLLFWKGHVAMVADETTLIHANAHHMAVTFEGITEASERIARQGDGQVTAHIRL